MIILGIDPGTAIVGYGVISTNTPSHLKQNIHEKPRVIDFGCITTTQFNTSSERLKMVYDGVMDLIEKYKPDAISVESLFFFKNLKTAMPVSQARGVILLAAEQHRIPIFESTPLQVKMTVVGYGRAEKKQVQEMTKKLLDLDGFDDKKKHRKKDDASDALGVALCALLKGFSL